MSTTPDTPTRTAVRTRFAQLARELGLRSMPAQPCARYALDLSGTHCPDCKHPTSRHPGAR